MTPTTLRIDSHVPIPKRRGRTRKVEWLSWPFAQMNVGDSFFCHAGGAHAQNVGRAANEFARINDFEFTQRTVDCDLIDRKPGIRVWRTK